MRFLSPDLNKKIFQENGFVWAPNTQYSLVSDPVVEETAPIDECILRFRNQENKKAFAEYLAKIDNHGVAISKQTDRMFLIASDKHNPSLAAHLKAFYESRNLPDAVKAALVAEVNECFLIKPPSPAR